MAPALAVQGSLVLATGDASIPVTWSQKVMDPISWWMDGTNLEVDVPQLTPLAYLLLFPDGVKFRMGV